MWRWRIAYGCGAHLGLVFLLEAALFLRVSNCSVIFLSFVRKLAVTKGYEVWANILKNKLINIHDVKVPFSRDLRF